VLKISKIMSSFKELSVSDQNEFDFALYVLALFLYSKRFYIKIL
jgi:hypothetical protein